MHILEDGRKWTKGKYYDLNTGQRCLQGALWFAEMQLGVDQTIYPAVKKHIPDHFSRIAHFNDALGTQWKDVKEVLNKAILNEKELS